MSAHILVLGSINVDYTVLVDRIPAPGETVMGSELMVARGGKGANQAVAAARAGASVALLGCVGDDAGGRDYLAALATEGVDASLVSVAGGLQTGTALIMVEPRTGENIIAVYPGANAHMTPAHVDAGRDCLAAAKVLLAQLEVPLETVLHAARSARQVGTAFVLNPSPVPHDGVSGELLGLTDYLICNETEGTRVAEAVGAASAEAAARDLIAAGTRAVILTRGARGCTVLSPEGTCDVPPFAVQAVDAVGAGDAFAGAFCAALAEGLPLAECARLANAAGALATTIPGAMPSLPRREQINALTGLL